MSIKSEINTASKRIEERKGKYENEIQNLDSKIKGYTKWAWGFVITGFCIFIYGVFEYALKDRYGFELNLLGDFTGGAVASIWSLAGLFLIYVAFLGQKQQLLNQQLEIMYSQLEVKYTRLELEGQKMEMIDQNKTLRKQRFENTFFQLLRNHQDIVNDIDIRRAIKGTGEMTVSHSGRDCFKIFYTKFNSGIQSTMPLGKILEVYMNFYSDYQADLGHYYRNLYHILKFINTSKELKENERYQYSSLLRALLSSYELALIFYNGIGDYGVEFFKPLIEKFSLLKNIDPRLLISSDHMSFYDELAFASSKERNNVLQERRNNNIIL